MNKIIEALGVIILKKMDLYSLYSLKKFGLLKEYGWFKSFKEEISVDANGNPLPWITYPSIEFLSKRINSNMSVFEYGSGGSTVWWASRVKDIVSVEHNKEWYRKTLTSVPVNVKLHYIELDYGRAYSEKISEYKNTFDIVVIDGRDRVNCAKNSIAALKPEGVIIWDNSDREEYSEGYQFLLENGFRKIEFIGLAPICPFKAETAIFYRTNNCLGI
ncbi:MAG TPA: hypothetical protein VFG09_02250 [Thermodesulfovibrionales bacterium]|nr:hypothetical protein [Thermodesulfovibrionales bacterium]